MSVDCRVKLLDWQKFTEANEASDDTEGLFHTEDYEDPTFVIDDEGEVMTDNVSYHDATFDASDAYDILREYLSPQQRDAADQIFAALFWSFDIKESGRSPWGPDFPNAPTDPSTEVKFRVFDAPVKGQQLYLAGLLSADTVSRLADLWDSELEESIAKLAQEHFSEEDVFDSFSDNEELCDYYSEWVNVLKYAADKNAGLAITVG